MYKNNLTYAELTQWFSPWITLGSVIDVILRSDPAEHFGHEQRGLMSFFFFVLLLKYRSVYDNMYHTSEHSSEKLQSWHKLWNHKHWSGGGNVNVEAKTQHGSENGHLEIHKPHNSINPQEHGFMFPFKGVRESVRYKMLNITVRSHQMWKALYRN